MPRSKPVRPSDLKTDRKGRVRRRSFIWRLRRPLFLLAIVVIAGLGGLAWVLSKVEIPSSNPTSQTSFICGADVSSGCNADNALAKLHGDQDRVDVPLSQVPRVLQQAVISIEDRNYFKHGGVDPVGIARAALTDIRGGGEQGGSTITQQYVKNAYLSQERTLTRKVKEAVIAVKLEQKMTKEQILEAYLNTIYFGRGAYGVQAASRVYFGKDVGQISLDQAAYLAGVIRGPETTDFQRNPKNAQLRRSLVLQAMLRDKAITPAERTFADAVPFTPPNYLPYAPTKQLDMFPKALGKGNEYFVEFIRQYLVNRYGEAAVYGGGLRVYTTLDLKAQAAAYDAVTSTLDRPDDPAAALVAIDDQGAVRAMMAGTDFSKSEVNLATGTGGGGGGRQPGSTFKAFALAETVHEGYSIQSVFTAPGRIVFPHADNGGPWTVNDGCCGGTANLIDATAYSANTVFAQLMLRIGPQKVVDMAHSLGVRAPLDPVPSLVLGTGQVSVLDMASAYSTFADGGVHVAPFAVVRVEDASGRVLESHTPKRTEVLSASENAKVVYPLQQVIVKGTATEAALGRPAAGKTGTTEDNKDAWFVGFTPKLTAAVWMGYPGGPGVPVKPMTNIHGISVYGGTFPAEMWAKFMKTYLAGVDTGDFPADNGTLYDGKYLNPDLVTASTYVSVPQPTGTGSSTTTTSTPAQGSSTTVPRSTTTATVPPTTAPPTTHPPPTTLPPPPTTLHP